MAQLYICSLPHAGAPGAPHECFYSDDAAGRIRAELFAKQENRPGRGVYDCIGKLQDGTRSRSKATVAELDKVVCDLDLKHIVEPRDEVIKVLQGLLLRPSEIRDSGFGLHAVWHFKEAADDAAGLEQAERIMTRLAALLASDPAPTHRAALLRHPGSDNFKSGEPRKCYAIEQGDQRYDISEFEDMFDLYGGRPLLTLKDKPAGNGHDTDAEGEHKAPIDIDARLAAMRHHGAGDSSINVTTLHVMASQLRRGVSLREAADVMIAAIRRCVAGEPEAATIDWRRQELEVLMSGARLINKDHTLVDRLPDDLRAKFEELDQAGQRPIIGKNSYKLYVRPSVYETKENAPKQNGAEEPKENPKKDDNPRLHRPIIYSCAQFVADLTPLDYLVDGILQRRFIYAFTGKTGDGKTSVVNLLAYCVAEGKPFGGHDCEKGTVFILVGENPDDVRMRWAGMAAEFGFDLNKLDIHFIPGVFSVSQIRGEIEQAAKKRNTKISLLVVDTSAAYFSGNDENSNVQLGGHARTLREAFVNLPGQPCVIVTNHPTKNPDMENLLPRGGGAYLAEVDGNLVAIRNETTVTMHWHGKFRGPDFDPMAFELAEVRAPALVDSKGRQIPTIIARALDDEAHARLRAKARADNSAVLRTLAAGKDMSLTDIAVAIGWHNKKGEANKSRARVVTDRLRKDGLVRLDQDMWVLTTSGEKAAQRAEQRYQEKSSDRA